MEEHYKVLGLKPPTTKSYDALVIRKAYRKRALTLHPDRCGGSEASASMFLKVKAAFDFLSSDTQRADYDSRFLAAAKCEQEADEVYRKKRKLAEELFVKEQAARPQKSAKPEAPKAAPKSCKPKPSPSVLNFHKFSRARVINMEEGFSDDEEIAAALESRARGAVKAAPLSRPSVRATNDDGADLVELQALLAAKLVAERNLCGEN